MTDTELMAALFVSEDGQVEAHPEWYRGCEVDASKGWDSFSSRIPRRVAAGILRLMRERDELRSEKKRLLADHSLYLDVLMGRDEAQAAAEEYHAAWMDTQQYWKAKVHRLEVQLQAVTENRDLMEAERDEFRDALEKYGRHQNYMCKGGKGVCTCGLSAALEGVSDAQLP